ncbi:MAG: NDP-sugar synthase [Polyangiales bacterium]
MRALVLCAGFGTRLGDLTRETPKPMLPIGDDALVGHTLRHLASLGFTDVAINLHFKPEVVEAHVGDGARYGLRVTYAREPELLGTAGAVRNLRDFLARDEDFLVLYGDLLIDEDFAEMLAEHRARGASATLLLHQRKGSNSLVKLDEGRVTGFVERPDEAERARNPFPWVNSGAQVLHRGMIDRIPEGRPSDLPRDVYIPSLAEVRIYGRPLTGYRCAIDSPARYDEARAAWAEGRYRPGPKARSKG